MLKDLLDKSWVDSRIKKEKIIHEVYINYEKQLMFIGRANMEENICVFYAFKCSLDRQNVDEAIEFISNWNIEKPVMNAWKCEQIVWPKENGYAKIAVSYNFWTPYLYEDIQRQVNSIVNKINILNADDVLGRAIAKYADLQPSSCMENRNETDTVNEALDFLQKADFLLLAENSKIRNAYLEYLKKKRRYYQRCMDMDK